MSRNQKAPLLERLRSTWVETTHYESDVGFLARDEITHRAEVNANPDGEEAATLIENLYRYVWHDEGCGANDLDYLDKAPCTCGLRKIYNPKGIDA